MDSYSLITSLILLALFQSLTSASPAPSQAPGRPAKAPSKLIQQICNYTDFYSSQQQVFCFHILGSDQRANKATNVIDLAIRGYQIAEINATRELGRIKELASSKKKMSPGLKLGLTNCVQAFLNIAGTYHDNQRIIKTDCLSADYGVFVIVDKINYCEDQLKPYKKEVVPFVWTSLQDAEKFMVLNKAITDLCSTKF